MFVELIQRRGQSVPIYRRIAVIRGTPRGLITKGPVPRTRADQPGEDYVIGIAVVLRADLSQDESAADDREDEHPRGVVRRRLAVKRHAESRLHLLSRHLPTSPLTPRRHKGLDVVTSPLNYYWRSLGCDRRPFGSLAAWPAEVDFLLRYTRRCTPERIRAPAPRSTDEANTSRAYFTHRRASERARARSLAPRALRIVERQW